MSLELKKKKKTTKKKKSPNLQEWVNQENTQGQVSQYKDKLFATPRH